MLNLFDIIKSIIIGIVQGITEFLPISSSGHILILKGLLNLEIDNTFDIVLHFGTLLAVLIFYRKEIFELITGIFKKRTDSVFFGKNLTRKNILMIWLFFIIATIPGGIFGLFLNDFFEFDTIPKWAFLLCIISFSITAFLLLSTIFIKPKEDKNIKSFGIIRSVIVGFFQALAILPGVSRSGSTITSSLFLGLNKKDSARFSFILSIPLILAAFLLKIFKLIRSPQSADINTIIILISGFITAFAVGYLSLIILIKILQKGKFWIFSIYLIIPIAVSFYLWLR